MIEKNPGDLKPRILTVEQAKMERMKMTYEQRYDLWMKLFRINKMLKQAQRLKH